MTPSRRPPVSAGFCEALAASLLLYARFWFLPLRDLWTDPVAILAAYWVFIRFGGTSRAAKPATLLVMTALLAIYAWGQVPQTVSVLGWKP